LKKNKESLKGYHQRQKKRKKRRGRRRKRKKRGKMDNFVKSQTQNGRFN
jgi:hypothetical protein